MCWDFCLSTVNYIIMENHFFLIYKRGFLSSSFLLFVFFSCSSIVFVHNINDLRDIWDYQGDYRVCSRRLGDYYNVTIAAVLSNTGMSKGIQGCPGKREKTIIIHSFIHICFSTVAQKEHSKYAAKLCLYLFEPSGDTSENELK